MDGTDKIRIFHKTRFESELTGSEICSLASFIRKHSFACNHYHFQTWVCNIHWGAYCKKIPLSTYRLYIAGCEPAVNKLYPPIEYPVSRGTPSISSYCSWFHGDRDAVAPHLNRAKVFHTFHFSLAKLKITCQLLLTLKFLRFL